MTDKTAEPWLRGTLNDLPAVPRAVIHALELARQDVEDWTRDLADEDFNSQPAGLPALAFHIRHIARSLDRLLTYAEARQLDEAQLYALRTEGGPGATRTELFAEFRAALERSFQRVRNLDISRIEEPRNVGKRALPTTLGGLLVHVADHTQRHVGQVVTTSKIIQSQKQRI